MPNRKRPSPYTPSRLQEMYWREGMTPDAIADHCRDSLEESRPARTTVMRWLKEVGITLRTKEEASRLYAKQHPIEMKKRGERIIAQHTYMAKNKLISMGDASQMHTRKARAAQRKAAAERALPEITMICVVCETPITKKPHRFQGGAFGFTCSNKCRIKLLAQIKQAISPPVECVCPVCKTQFTVQPNRLKRVPEPCCSRACRNKKTKTKGAS